MILRSTEWDGMAPAVGDVVQLADGVAVVTGVARGPGVGQWRLVCERARVITWRESRSARAGLEVSAPGSSTPGCANRAVVG